MTSQAREGASASFLELLQQSRSTQEESIGRKESGPHLLAHLRQLRCKHDLDGRLLSVDAVSAGLLGFPPEEILRTQLREMVNPRFRNQVETYLREVRSKGELRGIVALVTRTGERRYWQYHSSLRAEGINTQVVRCIAHDVTGRVHARKALLEENARLEQITREKELMIHELKLFRTLLDESTDAIEVIELGSLRFLDVNQSSCVQLGYTREELLSMTVFDIDPNITPASVARTLDQLQQSASLALEGVHRRKDGTTFPVEVSLKRVVLDREYVVGVSRDITERKLREGRVQEYERVVESLDEMIAVVDRDHRFVIANRALMAYRGMTRQQIVGHSIKEVLGEEVYESKIKHKLEECFRGKVVEFELRYSSPNLGERDLSLTYLPIERAKGIDRIAAVARDITHQKRAGAMLQESERQFRAVHERAPVGLALVDSRSGEFQRVNPKFCEIAGRTEEEMTRLRFQDITHPEDRDESSRQLSAMLEEKGRGCDFEKRYVRPNGAVVRVNLSIVPMWEPGEQARCHMVIVQDITERRLAEEALRQSEAELREAQRLGRIGSWYRDLKTDMFTGSEQMYRILRLDPKTPPGTFSDMERFFAPESWQRLNQANQTFLATRESDELEVEFRYPDGTRGWAVMQREAARAASGEVIGIRGVVLDISERKRTEEALRESEERLRLTQDVARIGSFDQNLITGETSCSHNLQAMYGRRPDQVSKSVQDFIDMIHPEDRPRVALLVAHSLESGEGHGEWRTIWNDGTVRWILSRWRVLKDATGDPVRVIGVDCDITDRKQAEEALRQSEERLRLAQDVAKIGTFDRNLLTGESRWTTQQEAIYGLLPGDFPRTIEQFLELVHPYDRKQVVALVAQSMESGEASGEWRIIWPDGTVRWIAGCWRVFRDPQGKPVRVIGCDYDITDRKASEEALRQSEERFRIALTGSPIKVYNQNRDLRYTWVYNPPEGWTAEDYMGKTDEEIFGAEDGARMRAIKQRVLDSGESERQEFPLVARGKEYYCDVTIEPLRDAKGNIVGVNSACVDITHIHQITEQLRLAKEKLTEEKLYLEQTIDTEMGFEEIIGRSSALRNVMESAGRVAASTATVLLLGETGTGKELVARAIHRLSQRRNNSFIKMNCAAIPSGLLESELFGAERGAFTGSVSRKVGRLELADKGTIFLDEIGEIALGLQPKLLRVLQDQEFERLGGTQTLKVDFRLIAATNRDLADDVQRNQFRRDLYYRLNVFPILIPPLRERREDIPLLVEHFLKKCARRMNKPIASVPSKTMAALVAWDWPGNVRELENFIERSIILSTGSVLAAPLTELQARTPIADGGNETLRAAERKHILEALRLSNGRISGENGAAARLGLKRTTLQSKLKQMGIDPRTPPYS
ncbi:MAG: PAS domain S-box protein [Terriglobales bacterium]